jgi:hypothetical protein
MARVRRRGEKGANAGGKVATVVAGADSTDDLDPARHGGVPSLLGCVHAGWNFSSEP